MTYTPANNTATRGDDTVLVRRELLKHRALHISEALFAVLPENVGYRRPPHSLLDDAVAVKETVLKHVAEHAAHCRFPAAHHPDKEDAGALQAASPFVMQSSPRKTEK
jgi:hypothetical protein